MNIVTLYKQDIPPALPKSKRWHDGIANKVLPAKAESILYAERKIVASRAEMKRLRRSRHRDKACGQAGLRFLRCAMAFEGS